MSKFKNGGLGPYGAEPFEQQRFGTAGVEGVSSVKPNKLTVKNRCGVSVHLKKIL